MSTLIIKNHKNNLVNKSEHDPSKLDRDGNPKLEYDMHIQKNNPINENGDQISLQPSIVIENQEISNHEQTNCAVIQEESQDDALIARPNYTYLESFEIEHAVPVRGRVFVNMVFSVIPVHKNTIPIFYNKCYNWNEKIVYNNVDFNKLLINMVELGDTEYCSRVSYDLFKYHMTYQFLHKPFPESYYAPYTINVKSLILRQKTEREAFNRHLRPIDPKNFQITATFSISLSAKMF